MHRCTATGTLLLFLIFHISSAQTADVFQSVKFTYKDGRSTFFSINKNVLLTKNRLELENQLVPDTVGLLSMEMDSIEFALVHQPENKERPHVIIKKVIDGKIELFRTPAASILDLYFVRKDGENFRELREYRRYVNESEFYLVKEFRSVLKYLFMDYPQIKDAEINQLSLNMKSLEKPILKYNRHFGGNADVTPIEEKDKRFNPSADIHFGGGLAFQAMRVAPSSRREKMQSYVFAGFSVIVKANRSSRFDFPVDLNFGKVSQYNMVDFTNSIAARVALGDMTGSNIHIGAGVAMTFEWSSEDESSRNTGSGYWPMLIAAYRYKALEVRYTGTFGKTYSSRYDDPSPEHRVGALLSLSQVFAKK